MPCAEAVAAEERVAADEHHATQYSLCASGKSCQHFRNEQPPSTTCQAGVPGPEPGTMGVLTRADGAPCRPRRPQEVHHQHGQDGGVPKLAVRAPAEQVPDGVLPCSQHTEHASHNPGRYAPFSLHNLGECAPRLSSPGARHTCSAAFTGGAFVLKAPQQPLPHPVTHQARSSALPARCSSWER